MESVTECPECKEFETPKLDRILRNVRWAIFGLSHEERLAAYGKEMAGMARAMGAVKEKKWYERHKEEWEKTGNAEEFERMLRHIKEGE